MNLIFRMLYVLIRSLFCERIEGGSYVSEFGPARAAQRHRYQSNNGRGRIMAEGTSKGCIYARGVGVVKPIDALATVEMDKLK